MSALRVCIITILLTGIYLLISIVVSNVLFFGKANGSLLKVNNKIAGSKIIGQNFKSNKYFHGRPSLYNYKNNISGCSNFLYFSSDLIKKTKENYNSFLHINLNEKPDLNIITESASGLDPHITYESALSQIKRISRERNVDGMIIKSIVDKKSKPRILNLVGNKIVNVLELNLELEKL